MLDINGYITNSQSSNLVEHAKKQRQTDPLVPTMLRNHHLEEPCDLVDFTHRSVRRKILSFNI